MATNKYSELTNTVEGTGEMFGEMARMAGALSAVKLLKGRDFKLRPGLEIAVYTFIQENLENWMKKGGWTLKQLMSDFIEDPTIVQVELGVQKWFLLLLAKYVGRMVMGPSVAFFHDSTDYALAVALRTSAGIFAGGWGDATGGFAKVMGVNPTGPVVKGQSVKGGKAFSDDWDVDGNAI